MTAHQRRIFNKALDAAGFKDTRVLAASQELNNPLQSLLHCGVPLRVIQDAMLAAELPWCEPCASVGVLRVGSEEMELVALPAKETVWVNLCPACVAKLE